MVKFCLFYYQLSLITYINFNLLQSQALSYQDCLLNAWYLFWRFKNFNLNVKDFLLQNCSLIWSHLLQYLIVLIWQKSLQLTYQQFRINTIFTIQLIVDIVILMYLMENIKQNTWSAIQISTDKILSLLFYYSFWILTTF